MKKILITSFVLSFCLTSCQTLSSTTHIKGKDAFILGNNKHGEFSVKLKNLSPANLEVWRAPIEGGQHSPMIVKPNEIVKVDVEKNTALRIENKANQEASVQLLVKGDTGLSMGYKN